MDAGSPSPTTGDRRPPGIVAGSPVGPELPATTQERCWSDRYGTK
jgi:hypothetical protein